jgi:hypothetical protein
MPGYLRSYCLGRPQTSRPLHRSQLQVGDTPEPPRIMGLVCVGLLAEMLVTCQRCPAPYMEMNGAFTLAAAALT